VRQAVIEQRPFCDLSPDAEASLAVQRIAQNLVRWTPQDHLDGNIKFFWKKLLFAE
jgi:flagellar biosynthesis protein FlhG